MSKTKEELDAIKEEVEAVNEKLQELTEEELAQVTGGEKAPVEGKKYADGNTPAAAKPTIKAVGWNAKEKMN